MEDSLHHQAVKAQTGIDRILFSEAICDSSDPVVSLKMMLTF